MVTVKRPATDPLVTVIDAAVAFTGCPSLAVADRHWWLLIFGKTAAEAEAIFDYRFGPEIP